MNPFEACLFIRCVQGTQRFLLNIMGNSHFFLMGTSSVLRALSMQVWPAALYVLAGFADGERLRRPRSSWVFGHEPMNARLVSRLGTACLPLVHLKKKWLLLIIFNKKRCVP